MQGIAQSSGLLWVRSGIFLFQQLSARFFKATFLNVCAQKSPLHAPGPEHGLFPGQATLSTPSVALGLAHSPPPHPLRPQCSAAASSQMPELPPGALETAPQCCDVFGWGVRALPALPGSRVTNPICISAFGGPGCSAGGPQTSQLFLETLASQCWMYECD